MTDPNIDLTNKGQQMFKQAFQEAMDRQLENLELKALAKTPPDAEYVTLKVRTTSEATRLMDRGWEMVTSLSLGRGAGFVSHILRKPRANLGLDMDLNALV